MPGDDSLASSIYAFTDSIPFKTIGSVHQTISGTEAGGGEGELNPFRFTDFARNPP